MRALAVLLLAACSSTDPTTCAEAAVRLGRQVCVHAIDDRATWTDIALPTDAIDQEGATTWLVPAHADARLPTLFVDANAFEDPEQSLHFKFLSEAFPELGIASYDRYLELTLHSATREWFGGSLTEYVAPDRASVFGFTVSDNGADDPLTCAGLLVVQAELARRVALGALAFVPSGELQRALASSCGVAVHDPSSAVAYEVYTDARGCGTLKRLRLAELPDAEAAAELDWSTVLVADEAPLDLQTVVAGIVTGTRQGALSHLAVRAASRGTPNCYVQDAYDVFAEWEGALVAVTCGPEGAEVEPITQAEAQACWDEARPDPVAVAPADLQWAALVPLLELPTETAAERALGVSRFGSKGANLATLYARIDPDLQLQGLLIPFRYYAEFLERGVWTVDLGAGPELATFADTLDAWHADPAFTSDAALRRGRLDDLQRAMRDTECDPVLVADIGTEILGVFGADDVMVRFRSSSNAEDALGFNGAGLYDSTSVCLADETDGDSAGPSHCDADKSSERDVCRGLTRVWASLWNPGAYEERDWYSIDHADVAMGILVNTRTPDERANVVAFTGNPALRGDDRYLVNAQIGTLDVVAALPGVVPEESLLTVDASGVQQIERVAGSTELPEGAWVLSDAELAELGEALWDISGVYPIDGEVPPGATVLLDTEWKLRSDGRFAIKQIRPFVR